MSDMFPWAQLGPGGGAEAQFTPGTVTHGDAGGGDLVRVPGQ